MCVSTLPSPSLSVPCICGILQSPCRKSTAFSAKDHFAKVFEWSFALLKCDTPICIPIFRQKEAVRDIKRLCETIALYEGCIFAPLKCVSPADPSRGDTFELKGKGDNPCRSAIPSTNPSPAAPAYRSRRGVAPEGSSLFRPGVEARSAEDPGNEDLGKDIRPR